MYGCVLQQRESEALEQTQHMNTIAATLRISTTSPHPPQRPWGTLSPSFPSLLTIFSSFCCYSPPESVGWWMRGRSMSITVTSLPPAQVCACTWMYVWMCVHVLHNLGSCANPRMHCTFPKSRNSTQTSRLSRHSSIVQYVCAISRLHEWNLLTFWQLVMRETVHRRPPVPKVSDVTNRSAEGGFDSLS